MNLSVKDGEVVDYNVKNIALDATVGDDVEMSSVVPRCYSNRDCWSPDMRGICQQPGGQFANCVFEEIVKIPMFTIVPKDCRTCRMEQVIENLKAIFPGLQIENLNTDDPFAKKLMKELGIDMLPAFVLSKQVEKDSNFAQFSQIAFPTDGEYYYLKPGVAGVSYFSGRKRLPGRLDLFMMLTQPGAFAIYDLANELIQEKDAKVQLSLHFIGLQDVETGAFQNPNGIREIEEDKLYCCIEKHYPKKAWDYLSCRTKNIQSLWWGDCLEEGMDAGLITECAKGEESNQLLKEKIKLSEELQIFYSPLFLLENAEIFGITLQTTKEEILNLLDVKKNKP